MFLFGKRRRQSLMPPVSPHNALRGVSQQDTPVCTCAQNKPTSGCVPEKHTQAQNRPACSRPDKAVFVKFSKKGLQSLPVSVTIGNRLKGLGGIDLRQTAGRSQHPAAPCEYPSVKLPYPARRLYVVPRAYYIRFPAVMQYGKRNFSRRVRLIRWIMRC